MEITVIFGYSSASFDEWAFAGPTPREQGKLLARFLFRWIHQNGRQPLFLFPTRSWSFRAVACSLFPVPSPGINSRISLTLSCNDICPMTQRVNGSGRPPALHPSFFP